jgi:signal transduction histidine kinase/CheY-like chemotaxis protein
MAPLTMAPLCVLLVEDSEDDALLLLRELRRAGYELTWERVDTPAAMVEALQRRMWDIVLCDYVLPQFSGPMALQLLYDTAPEVPALIVSGEAGEEFAVTAIKGGAQDYVLKDNLRRLVPAVQRALREAEERRARKRAEADKATLLEMVRDLSGSLDRREILERVQRRVAALLPCDRVATFQWEDARGAFVASALHGIPEALHAGASAVEFVKGQPVVDWVLSGQTVVVNDLSAQPWFSTELLTQFDLAAVVGVPMLARGHVVGVLTAARVRPGIPFDSRAVQLLEGIARQVAMIIDTAEAYRAQQEEAQVSAALARIGQELIQSLDRPVLLDRLCRSTTEALGCDCSHTLLWDPAEQGYAVVSGCGDTAEQWESIRVLKIPGVVVPELIARLERDDVVALPMNDGQTLLPTGLSRQYEVTSGMYAALRRGGELIGIHTAGYRGQSTPFTTQQTRTMRGIAQLASLALEHARVLEELERANRLKYDFVATMSHELRTPLNVIMGYSDLLVEGGFGPLTADQGDIIRRVARSGRQLLELINATLDLGRLEAGRMAPQPREVRLAEFFRELDVETHEVQQKPGVRFEWQLPLRLPVISTDPLKLKVVIKNLMGNAMKFTEVGSVCVSVSARERGVEIAVSDTGIGIAPEVQPIIFEPFRQADSSTTRRYGGVGLGLYIVRRLIDVLGGTISLETEVGRGSTFRVWLPSGRGPAASV